MSIIKDVFNVLDYNSLEVLKECNDVEWKSGWVLPKAKNLLKGNFLKEIRGTQILGVLAGDKKLTEIMISELPEIAKLSIKAIDKVSKNITTYGCINHTPDIGKSVALIARFNTKAASIAAENYCAKGSIEIVEPMISELNENKDVIVDLNPALDALKERDCYNMWDVTEWPKAEVILREYIDAHEEHLDLAKNLGLS